MMSALFSKDEIESSEVLATFAVNHAPKLSRLSIQISEVVAEPLHPVGYF